MKVTADDLIGALKGFPIEIVEKMIENQVKQGNRECIGIFQYNKLVTQPEGGFNWDRTKEGYIFWSDVITKMNFDRFFNLYPITTNKEKKTIKISKKAMMELFNLEGSAKDYNFEFND